MVNKSNELISYINIDMVNKSNELISYINIDMEQIGEELKEDMHKIEEDRYGANR
jgi:hypothetical protein